MRRWPIRIRLTAAFTAMMALVLAGVATGTVMHARAALDEPISQDLQYRLRDLQPAAATATPATVLPGGSRDTGVQVLDAAGTVVGSSREVAGQPLIDEAEQTAARRGQLLTDHARAGTLAGPVRVAARPVGADRIAVAAVSLAGRDAAVADLRAELALAFPLVLLAAAVGAYLLAGAALRPVERMRSRAAAITTDDPGQRLPVPAARDEISRLGATLNDLLTRLHGALSRERRFVADASHELRTPLGLLTTELELALRRPRGPEELTAALHSALEETGRLSRLAQDLLLLARTDQPEHQPDTSATQLGPLLESVLARYRTVAAEDTLMLDCPQGLTVLADVDDLDRAVSNLLDNDLQHGCGPITVSAHVPAAAGSQQAVTIEVRDHGPGFDPEFLPRAFERFTRGDNARTRGGTGLGLAITAALAARNHGHVTASNHPDGGAVLTLTYSSTARR